MIRKEYEIESECKRIARARGWVIWKNVPDGCKGIPDDLFISPDQVAHLVEFKKDERQKPRPEQALWLARFSKIAHLVGSFDEFCRVLKIPPSAPSK